MVDSATFVHGVLLFLELHLKEYLFFKFSSYQYSRVFIHLKSVGAFLNCQNSLLHFGFVVQLHNVFATVGEQSYHFFGDLFMGLFC